jgi:hypothetical protein
MNRRDIADYRGPLETVSRALSALQNEDFFKFLGQIQREIVGLIPSGRAELDKSNFRSFLRHHNVACSCER